MKRVEKRSKSGFREINGSCLQFRILDDGRFEIIGKIRSGDSIEDQLSQAASIISREMEIRMEKSRRGKTDSRADRTRDTGHPLPFRDQRGVDVLEKSATPARLDEIQPIVGSRSTKKIAG